MRSTVLGAASMVTAVLCSAPAMAYPVTFSASGTFAPYSSLTGTFTSKGGSYSVSGTAKEANDFIGVVSLNIDGLMPFSGTGYAVASFGRYNDLDLLDLDLVGSNPAEVFVLTLFAQNGPSRAGAYDLSKLSFEPSLSAGIGFYPTGLDTSDEFYTATVSSFSVSGTATLTGQVSPVPLPASAPLFGAALLGLGALGYGMKRQAARAACR